MISIEPTASAAGSRPANGHTADLPTISVAVPVFNEEQSLGACIRSILDQDYPTEKVEIFVVDGGSTDASLGIAEELAQRFPRIRRLANPARQVSSGLNLALEHARGDLFVRVDAHTEIASDYFSRCVEALTRTGADNVGGPMHPVGDTPITRAIACAMRHPFGVGPARFRFARRPAEVDTVYMGAFRREIFAEVGGFNESLERNQDYEMNFRIRRAGGKVFVDPSIRSRYRPRADLRALGLQFEGYGFWKFRMLQKHPRSLRLRQTVAPLFVLALAVSAALGLASLAPGLLPGVARWAFPLVLGAYFLACLGTSLQIGFRHGLSLVPRLLPIFATLHLSWGLGFWRGAAQAIGIGSGHPVEPGRE